MNYWRAGQVVGVLVCGLGIGLMYAEPAMGGGLWSAMGLMVYVVCRLVPWLTQR